MAGHGNPNWTKGKSGNPKGRTAGTPNKVTASIKAAFKESFDNLGGPEALTTWARENPTEFYKLAARLIPTEIVGNEGGPLVVQVVSGYRITDGGDVDAVDAERVGHSDVAAIRDTRGEAPPKD